MNKRTSVGLTWVPSSHHTSASNEEEEKEEEEWEEAGAEWDGERRSLRMRQAVRAGCFLNGAKLSPRATASCALYARLESEAVSAVCTPRVRGDLRFMHA